MKEIVILDGARTPFGTFCGSLRELSAIELGAIASREAMRRAGVDPARVDNVVFGNALQTSPDAIYMARHVGLKAGVPLEVPALTVNRLCGSGLQALVTAAQSILLGESEVALAGGAENMSQAPFVIRGARWGLGLGEGQLEDYLWAALLDTYNNMPMAITAENLAVKYGISRQEQDEFACRSHQAAARARESGRLREEIVAVELRDRRGNVTVIDQDEHIRPNTSLESLARLKPRFKADGGVTAGNASGINDGAAALVLATRERAEREGWKMLGRMVSWGLAGVDPDIMGIGPVPSSRRALERAGLSLEDIDLVEINEAFAAQYLAVEKEMGLDRDRVNVNGGAIAIGHPLAASGARLALTLLYELRRRRKRYGLASLCIGGGQGIAVIFESL